MFACMDWVRLGCERAVSELILCDINSGICFENPVRNVVLCIWIVNTVEHGVSWCVCVHCNTTAADGARAYRFVSIAALRYGKRCNLHWFFSSRIAANKSEIVIAISSSVINDTFMLHWMKLSTACVCMCAVCLSIRHSLFNCRYACMNAVRKDKWCVLCDCGAGFALQWIAAHGLPSHLTVSLPFHQFKMDNLWLIIMCGMVVESATTPCTNKRTRWNPIDLNYSTKQPANIGDNFKVLLATRT